MLLRLPLLAALPLTIGCLGDDLEPPAVDPVIGGESFVHYTPAERQRAIAAAHGQDAQVALFAYHAYREGTAACPRREVSGDTTTITGDCSTPNGERISGRIVATGAVTSPTSVVFDAFMVDGASDLAIDGEIRSTITDGVATRVQSLTVTRGGIAVQSDFTSSCAQGVCTIAPDGKLEVLGHETVTPSRDAAAVTLTGRRDLLAFTLEAGADCGEHAITRDGAVLRSGKTCLWSLGGAPTFDPFAGITNFTYGCSESGVSASVEATLAGKVTIALPTTFTWEGRFAPLSLTLPFFATATFDNLQAGADGALVASTKVVGLDCKAAARVIGWQGSVVAADGTRRDAIELFAEPRARLDR